MVTNLLKSKVSEIRVFSRDEKKQDDMRKMFKDSRLKFILGDIRDKSSVSDAVQNVNFVFHAAALKQVPSCEFYPMEAVKTNILGVDKLIDQAVKAKVKMVKFLLKNHLQQQFRL